MHKKGNERYDRVSPMNITIQLKQYAQNLQYDPKLCLTRRIQLAIAMSSSKYSVKCVILQLQKKENTTKMRRKLSVQDQNRREFSDKDD